MPRVSAQDLLAQEWRKVRWFRDEDGRKKYTPEYHSWNSMRARCNNPKHNKYRRYGGRGIKVCPRWNDFDTFLADMGPKPPDAHSIERLDNNGDYEPSNCVWATQFQQDRNKSTTVLVCWDDHVMCLSDASDYFGIAYKLVRCRVYRGWSISKSLLTCPTEYRGYPNPSPRKDRAA